MKFRIVALLVLIVLFAGFQNVYAIDGSRFFTFLMFCSGVGSSLFGAYTQGQANGIYDEYLHTPVQSEMNNLIDDYEKKHQQSIIAYRAGIGLAIGSILLSFIDAAGIQQSPAQKEPDIFGYENSDQKIGMKIQNGIISLSVAERF